jgi:carbon storage regulator
MLVLSRRPGERIVINESIVVTILHTPRGRVRVGIDAPADVPIFRDETTKPKAASLSGRREVALAPPPGPAQ